MAHACDYQSRPPYTWRASQVVLAQLKQAITNLRKEGWTEHAIKEYCLVAYSSMGATDSVYRKVIKILSTENKGV